MQLLLDVDALHTLAVYLHALPAQQNVQAAVSEAPALPGQFAEPLAQLGVALMVVLSVVASRTWAEMRPSASRFARGLGALGPWVAAIVYFQIALGAWLRHQGEVAALLVHGAQA